MRSFVMMMVAAGLIGAAPSPSLAAGEPPTDAQLLGAKTVGVLPVLTAGPSRKDAYARLANTATRGVEAKRGGSVAAMMDLGGDGGAMAFAGSSSTSDVRILQYAIVAGSLGSDLVVDDLYQKAVAFLESYREVLASLSPKVIAAMDRFVAAAKTGRIDTQALSDSLAAAEEGIATGPARGHGYFVTGMWLGISVIVAALDEPDLEFAGMARPIATLLEEDAGFGGSDQALAKEVRALGEVLAKPGFTVESVKPHLNAAVAVKPDAAE